MTVATEVRALIAAHDRYRQALAITLDISVPEVIVLEHLHHAGQATPTAIAGRLGVTSASVTGLLDRLGDYVTRSPNTEDRRSVLVSLTGHGREAITAAFGPLDTALEQAVAGIPGPLRFLQLIAAAFRDHAKQAGR